MADSYNIKAVLIDGEYANVGIDDDTALSANKEQDIEGQPEMEEPEIDKERETEGQPEKEEPEIDTEREIEDQPLDEEEKTKRSRWFGAGKNKEEAEAETKERDAESGSSKEEVVQDITDNDDDKSVFGNFAASFLNFCTLGLFSSSSSPKESDEKSQALADGEREMHMVESQQSTYRTETIATRDQALVSEYSINTDDNNSGEPILRHRSKEIRTKTKLNAIVSYCCMVLIFLVMAGLFISGGILWKRNGF